MCWGREGTRRSEMAARPGRSKSTVSRELARNSFGGRCRASTAQKKREARRRRCVRPRELDDPATLEPASDKLLGGQWSPEQVETRLKIEGPEVSVSDAAICRAVRAGGFDKCVPKRAKASRELRHKGRGRGSKGCSEERRGRFEVPARIGQGPSAADGRSGAGHRESDAVEGAPGGARVVTNVDGKSGFAIGGRAARRGEAEVAAVMKERLAGHAAKSRAPDRGRELAGFADVANACGARFHFAHPRHPWERGCNENFDGPLRGYLPKGMSLDDVPDGEIRAALDRLNLRPRKRLGWRTPYEVYHSVELHLV